MSAELYSVERVSRILNHEPVDRIAAYESFWGFTKDKWVRDGYVNQEEELNDHFDLDIRGNWPFTLTADLDFGEELVEETEETKLVRSGNGALLRYHKQHASTPEHVDFLVKDKATWDEHVRPFLVDSSRFRDRINFEGYRQARQNAAEQNRYFTWSGVSVFECMHPVAGHENMLMGMALEPDWIKDMCDVYTDMTIAMMEILFAEEGEPDGIWFYEDMGFKQKPFMSPDMYMDLVNPSHKRLFDYAHSIDKKVIVHSCGFVEALVPGLIEAGMDCLQAMEVKAGMDVVKLKKMYGDTLAFMGGIDVRVIDSNDKDKIKAELEKILPTVMEGSGYILFSDHSIPESTEYEAYKYFLDLGREIGTYK